MVAPTTSIAVPEADQRQATTRHVVSFLLDAVEQITDDHVRAHAMDPWLDVLMDEAPADLRFRIDAALKSLACAAAELREVPPTFGAEVHRDAVALTRRVAERAAADRGKAETVALHGDLPVRALGYGEYPQLTHVAEVLSAPWQVRGLLPRHLDPEELGARQGWEITRHRTREEADAALADAWDDYLARVPAAPHAIEYVGVTFDDGTQPVVALRNDAGSITDGATVPCPQCLDRSDPHPWLEWRDLEDDGTALGLPAEVHCPRCRTVFPHLDIAATYGRAPRRGGA